MREAEGTEENESEANEGESEGRERARGAASNRKVRRPPESFVHVVTRLIYSRNARVVVAKLDLTRFSSRPPYLNHPPPTTHTVLPPNHHPLSPPTHHPPPTHVIAHRPTRR